MSAEILENPQEIHRNTYEDSDPVFTAEDRQKIQDALKKYLGVEDPEVLKSITNEICTSGVIRTFGFGSLIKDPFSSEDTNKYDGVVEGQVTRFNTAWTYYGGTKDFPSFMMGLEDDENGSTPGVVSEFNIFEQDVDPSAESIVQYLKEWDARENPPENPVYKFNFVKVIPQGGGEPVLAVACVTDTEGPLFVGDALTLEEKAIIIASEYGDERQKLMSGLFVPDGNMQPRKPTVHNYVREFLDARIDKGFPIEQELLNLGQALNYVRSVMPESQREFMVKKESKQLDIRADNLVENLDEVSKRIKLSNSGDLTAVFQSLHQEKRDLDPKVFTMQANGPEMTEEEFAATLHSARNKLRAQIGMEPLPDLPENKGYDPVKMELEYFKADGTSLDAVSVLDQKSDTLLNNDPLLPGKQ